MKEVMKHSIRLLSVSGILIPVLAFAENTAYVNMETIFEGYYKTVRANVAFENKKKDFQDRAGVLEEEIKSMISEAKKLEDDTNNDLLSEESRKESERKLKFRVERLRAKDEEFRQFKRAGLKDLQQARLTAEEELITDLSKFVADFCKGKGFDLVYDVNGKSLNRMPVLLVYPENKDVTTEILAALNAGHEDELAKAQAELEALGGASKALGSGDEGDTAPVPVE